MNFEDFRVTAVHKTVFETKETALEAVKKCGLTVKSTIVYSACETWLQCEQNGVLYCFRFRGS